MTVQSTISSGSVTPANTNQPSGGAADLNALDYVTITIDGQMFGLPIQRVHDVFLPSQITIVPLAPPEIVGLLNLRGRVVTAISLRHRMKMPACDAAGATLMAVGIEHKGEAFALIVDAVGEVLRLGESTFEPNPVHLDAGWAAVSAGVHRLEDKLLIVLDVDAVLTFDISAAA
ncbi:MAG: chemotaxis protein CheW [Bosea sp. (in: a-proteobacteria)]